MGEPKGLRDLVPVSIVPDRYSGSYARLRPGGRSDRWLAFPCESWEVPREPFDDDNVAEDWWSSVRVPIGGGRSPSDAYADLVGQLVAIRPTRVYGPNPAQGTWAWEWERQWPDGHASLVCSLTEPADWG